MAYAATLRPAVAARLLVVHVQNGLGNRLRAMAGGIALAKATGRVPIVVWERDAHLSASYTDLFHHPSPRDAAPYPSVDARPGYGSARLRSAGVTRYDNPVRARPGSPPELTVEMEAFLYRDFVLVDSFLSWPDAASISDVVWMPINQMRKETDDESPFLYFEDDMPSSDTELQAAAVSTISAEIASHDAAEAAAETEAAAAAAVDHYIDADADNYAAVNAASSINSGAQLERGAGQAAQPGKLAITPSHHLYVKTAYLPVTLPYRSVVLRADIDLLIRRLVPSTRVQEIVATSMPENIHTAVGVHIRSRSVDNDNVNVDRNCEYTSDGADLTDYWRKQSQVPVFVDKMERYQELNPAIHFFVAADDFRTIELLKKRFPGRIANIERTCDDRTPDCVQFALADLVCLGRTRKIIGSNWSSFSETAGRLSGGPLFLSGVHFGRMPAPSSVQRWKKYITEALRVPRIAAANPFYKCKTRQTVSAASVQRRT